MVGKEINARQIATWLKIAHPTFCVIEQAQAMPKQGVTSMFNYGRGYGKLLGVLEALGVPHETVRPTAWKKVVLAGTKKDKDAAIEHVMRAYPGIPLVWGRRKVPHDGIADAACLAEYAKIKYGEE